MLTSEVPAIGYNLAKIKGYDPNVAISKQGWVVIYHILLKMIQAQDLSAFQKCLKTQSQRNTCSRLTEAQMHILQRIPEGEDPFAELRICTILVDI